MTTPRTLLDRPPRARLTPEVKALIARFFALDSELLVALRDPCDQHPFYRSGSPTRHEELCLILNRLHARIPNLSLGGETPQLLALVGEHEEAELEEARP